MDKKSGPITKIERWISENGIRGLFHNIPLDYNRKEDIYWRIGPHVYGPIKWKDIPTEIRNHI